MSDNLEHVAEELARRTLALEGDVGLARGPVHVTKRFPETGLRVSIDRSEDGEPLVVTVVADSPQQAAFRRVAFRWGANGEFERIT